MKNVKSFHPDLLPTSSDPVGSTRYHCRIAHLMHKSNTFNIVYVDAIESTNLFIVDEYAPYFNDTGEMFMGKVVNEGNGKFSWWKDLNCEGKYSYWNGWGDYNN